MTIAVDLGRKANKQTKTLCMFVFDRLTTPMPLNVYHAQQGIPLCMFVFDRLTTPIPLNVYHASKVLLSVCLFLTG